MTSTPSRLVRNSQFVVLLAAFICNSNFTGTHSAKAAEPTASESKGASVSDWPQFHGTHSLGVASQGALPKSWTSNDYAWKLSLGGEDVGSPVITGGVVYLVDIGQSNNTIDLIAVDLQTGELQWRKSHPLADRRRHKRNSPASTTPVVDQDQVYFCYGDASGAYLHAYSLDGQPRWSRELGSWTGYHGFGTSPMLVDDKVVLFNSQQTERLEADQVAGQSRMMTFNRQTGEDVWSTELKTTRPSYGVPAIYQPTDSAPKQLIAANTGNGLFGLDLASGELLWQLPVFDKRCCSSPVIVGDLAVASCGSGGGGNILSAVKIPASKDKKPEEVFRIETAAPYVPTPTIRDGLMFLIADSGIATCLDIADGGSKVWAQRLRGNFGASPIVVGDQLLLISLEGTAYVLSATRENRRPISFDLGGGVGATPAYADDRLLLRIGDQLCCLKTGS